MTTEPTPPETPEEERISLHGHDPEEVLRALLQVDPDSEPEPVERDPKRSQDDLRRRGEDQ